MSLCSLCWLGEFDNISFFKEVDLSRKSKQFPSVSCRSLFEGSVWFGCKQFKIKTQYTVLYICINLSIQFLIRLLPQGLRGVHWFHHDYLFFLEQKLCCSNQYSHMATCDGAMTMDAQFFFLSIVPSKRHTRRKEEPKLWCHWNVYPSRVMQESQVTFLWCALELHVCEGNTGCAHRCLRWSAGMK